MVFAMVLVACWVMVHMRLVEKGRERVALTSHEPNEPAVIDCWVGKTSLTL